MIGKLEFDLETRSVQCWNAVCKIRQQGNRSIWIFCTSCSHSLARWVFNFPCKSWDGWFYQIRMEPFQALVSPKWWWWWWWGRWSNLIFADKIWDSIFVHIEFTVFPLKCTTFHQNVLFFLLQFLEFNLKLSPHQFSPRTQSATKYEVCRWVTNIRFEVWGMWYAMGEKYEVWGMRWVTNVRYLQIGEIYQTEEPGRGDENRNAAVKC